MKRQTITEQELVVIRLLQQGRTNAMISNEVGISINTVKFHLKNIYRKLEVSNRVSAINKFNEFLKI